MARQIRRAMNDADFDPGMERDKVRIMALGDSHTYAVGVSMEETWAKVLERRLNETAGGVVVRTCNAGVPGYNLHQYLMRLIDQGPIIRPRYVIVGLSYATDFYDLLPPDRGGWIYGGDMARHYFDFDAGGVLTERVWRMEERGQIPRESLNAQRLSAQSVREFLDRSSTFRFLRRSRLALFAGSKLRLGGQSLWPNMEVILERDVSPRHECQVRLAFALLAKIREECQRMGAGLIVVGVPYLPQVYDDVWSMTFGGDERFSRTAGIERTVKFCSENGIRYIDTLEAFRERVRREGRWMHHRKDAHPTAEGHEIIADAIVAAGVIDMSVSSP